jgi:hypothetical protein
MLFAASPSSSAARRVFGEFARVCGGERGLYLAQARDRVAYAVGELFDGLDSSARRVAQLLAQEQLRLTYQARERVVYLVAHARRKLGELRQARVALGDSAAQLLLLAPRDSSTVGARFTLTHL